MRDVEILIVEDEEIIALDIESRLQELDYKVVASTNTGEEAISLTEKLMPSLVLMDIALKGEMDGTVAAKHISASFHIPIIFLTSYSDDDTLDRAKLSSPYGYITKPFETKDLRNAIELSLFKHGIDIKIIASEQRYRAVMEHSSSGILISNLDGDILELNKHAEEIFGRQKNEILGSNFKKFLPPTEHQYADLQIKKLLSEKIIGPNDGYILQPDGSVRDVDFTAIYVENEQEKFIFSVLNDTTERNRLRAQTVLSDKLAAIGKIATSIIHEINNPMTFILANLQYINNQFKTTDSGDIQFNVPLVKISEAVNESIQGAKRIEEIVRGLKGFARAEHQTQATLDIHEVLSSVVKMASPELKKHAILKTDFDDNLPRLLLNSAKLHQVFLNLIINAIQSMDEASSSKNIVLIKTYKENNYICIDVIDNGKGMSSELQASIFDPFFTTKELGTGLGLSICYDLLQEIGGNISVKSKPGEGTVFSVHLPLNLIAEKEITREVKSIVTGKTILLIDDDPAVLGALNRIIGIGNKVTKVQGGRSAFYLLGENSIHYDVIVCNLNMDDVAGIDLYRYVCEHNQELANRMVFLTDGMHLTSNEETFLSTIKNPCLEMSFTREQLLQAVITIVSH